MNNENNKVKKIKGVKGFFNSRRNVLLVGLVLPIVILIIVAGGWSILSGIFSAVKSVVAVVLPSVWSICFCIYIAIISFFFGKANRK